MSATFKDLEVWQQAMELAEAVYRITQPFPKEELFVLTSQARRAVVSIPSNIAEGSGRKSDSEFLQFLSIANGSLRELETQMMLDARIGYLAPTQLYPLQTQMDTVGRLLTGLRKSIRQRTTNP